MGEGSDGNQEKVGAGRQDSLDVSARGNTKDAATIARIMASKKVSPNGIGSGIRMIQYSINRSGKNLPAGRKRELEKAKRILQARRQQRLNPPRLLVLSEPRTQQSRVSGTPLRCVRGLDRA